MPSASALATPACLQRTEFRAIGKNDKRRTTATPPVEIEAGLDFETCMEQVWEQLISAPPSRGRSMTTVRVGSARLLMSSWEVAAFVSEDGPAAEDLRRAVVARALVTAALEQAKETGKPLRSIAFCLSPAWKFRVCRNASKWPNKPKTPKPP